MTLVVACCLWAANQKSEPHSRVYTEQWVEKLQRCFSRNLRVPFRFVCFTDRTRKFIGPIEQERLTAELPDYGSMIEPFRMNEPMILCGLDTVVVGDITHMAEYCLTADRIALPRDPYMPERSINGVALIPRGWSHVWTGWRGENDMVWLRQFETAFIDDLFPGQVLSLKAHRIRDEGLKDARIVYMHGEPKQPSLMHLDWMKEHWR